ncbi:MAG: hypothetical protein ACERJ1_15520 [Halodesulfovibrio sp.]|uniref:lipase family protein n=1 Tax=Halodesulfovibrio sp. TaxID=1912772 RepID=UPI00359D58AE
MAVDNSQYCVSCNPSENWIQLEFRSEKDEAISSLEVTIVDAENSEQKQKTNGKGIVTFGKVALGQVGVFVSLDSLLEEVEKYPKRDKEKEPDSPVKERAEKEQNAKKEDTKLYRHVSIGDLWDEKPEDEDLVKIQEPLNDVRGNSDFGIKAPVNETTTYEVQAVRSLMPAIIDTDKYSLVNSYTFSLLATLAYATEYKNEDKKKAGQSGSIKTVVDKLAVGQDPMQSSTAKVDWLTIEIPYSQRLRYQYYENIEVGSQAYALFNDEIVIIGVRGTETDMRFVDSPLFDDVASDLDGFQIETKEFGKGIHIHRGFYEYTKSFWSKIYDDFKEVYSNRNVFVCGHSLGGAGALVLAALIEREVSPPLIRLFTYGMPRTGTKKFALAFQNITHYRHVNNNDIITQVPYKWANTNSFGGREFDKRRNAATFLLLLGSIFLDDDSNDDYCHHGNLVQLFAYSKQKNAYDTPNNDEVKQILLLPSQHRIRSIDIALNGTNDSFALADDVDFSEMRRGGYVETVMRAGCNHMMTEYIPNIKKQLHILAHQKQEEVYVNTCEILKKRIDQLEIVKKKVNGECTKLKPKALCARHGRSAVQNAASRKLSVLQVELKMTNNLLYDRKVLREELLKIVKSANTTQSVQEILYGSPALMTEEIAEQLP